MHTCMPSCSSIRNYFAFPHNVLNITAHLGNSLPLGVLRIACSNARRVWYHNSVKAPVCNRQCLSDSSLSSVHSCISPALSPSSLPLSIRCTRVFVCYLSCASVCTYTDTTHLGNLDPLPASGVLRSFCSNARRVW